MTPDDLPGFVVMNPDAVGDADQSPRLFAGVGLRRLLNPCDGAAPSREGYCGGVNGCHAPDCPSSPAPEETP